MAKKETPPFPGMRQFLVEAPLYARFVIHNGDDWIKDAMSLYASGFRFDAHCAQCGRDAIFYRSNDAIYGHATMMLNDALDEIPVQIELSCFRDRNHKMLFHLRKEGGTIQKIGQWPSLADIALDELKEYKALLQGTDGAEFHKAIGLAAHGVGVGSFVYLRRIFERLIDNTYQANKVAKAWSDEEFNKKRMPEKVAHLADFLPEFLVENRAVYAILSKGLHDLAEDECLAYFDPLKQAIIVILEQERERQRKKQAQDALAKSLAKIAGAPGSAAPKNEDHPA